MLPPTLRYGMDAHTHKRTHSCLRSLARNGVLFCSLPRVRELEEQRRAKRLQDLGEQLAEVGGSSGQSGTREEGGESGVFALHEANDFFFFFFNSPCSTEYKVHEARIPLWVSVCSCVFLIGDQAQRATAMLSKEAAAAESELRNATLLVKEQEQGSLISRRYRFAV